MSKKLLLALAGCLPIALSGCGGGGGASLPSGEIQTPSGGTQTPTAALDAAKTAVDNANSARTEAAVQRARRALSAAVETAEAAKTAAQAALTEAQAALTEAQDYRTAQAAILDGLQPITAASLSLATVKPASTAAEAAAALAAARNAVAAATSTRTAAAIQRARRALSEAVETAGAFKTAAQDDLDAAQSALAEAQNYRNAQTRVLDSLPIARPPEQPSSPPGEFETTHRVWSSIYAPSSGGIGPTAARNSDRNQYGDAYRPTLRAARNLADGFSRVTLANGVAVARKTSMIPARPLPEPSPDASPLEIGRYIRSLYGLRTDTFVGSGDYSAFEVIRFGTTGPVARPPGWTLSGGGYTGGHSGAFGQRSPGVSNHLLSASYRGAMAGVWFADGNFDHPDGTTFTGTAVLLFTSTETGNRLRLNLEATTGREWSHSSSAAVNNDGSFVDIRPPGAPTNLFGIKGNFYGPNLEEAAGIVETSNVYGAWLVRQVGSTSGGDGG